jgi:hypothetical protein
MSDKDIQFVPSGRGKARCAPDPAFPKGKAIGLPEGIRDSCLVELPYPAPECGMYVVTCSDCGCSTMVTAAGRPDDPVSFYMPCQKGRS